MAWFSFARLREHLTPLLVVFALGSSCALLGATGSAFAQPSVVIYPLTGTGQTPSDAGGNIALVLSTKLAQLGGIDIKPYTPGTLRAQYLSAAQTQGVDYYITGFLTPVGSDAALIVQVVSVASGSVIYSNTATVRTYADVVAQADTLREAVLRHAGRGIPAVAPVASATTAPPLASAGSVNLTKALGRHPARRSGPVPWGVVINVAGDATDAQRLAAQQAFEHALPAAGLQGEILAVDAADVIKNASDLCKANPKTLGFFMLTLAAPGSEAALDVSSVGCDGAIAGKQTASRPITGNGTALAAIQEAARAAAAAIAPTLKSLGTPKPAAT